jgi:hypothetical protein
LRAEVDRLRQEVSSVAIENVGLRGERARIEPSALHPLRIFAEWAAGARCDDEYAPRMVQHIAALASEALAGKVGDPYTPPPPSPDEDQHSTRVQFDKYHAMQTLLMAIAHAPEPTPWSQQAADILSGSALTKRTSPRDKLCEPCKGSGKVFGNDEGGFYVQLGSCDACGGTGLRAALGERSDDR